MSNPAVQPDPHSMSTIDRVIHFCLTNKLVVALITAGIVLWGLATAPFDWHLPWLPRDADSRLFGPVAVDAIPDIGENQQIVFTDWMGRSPQDVQDQVTYPLTVAMLGIPGVKTVRSYSMFGFSSIYIIFKENREFYWTRTRVLEKLSSLPPGSLPEGVKPVLGPDATGLGQVFWYTLEGRDPEGKPTGGWGLDELRSLQDWTVRYALLSADGIAEVAAVGGHVKEYQIDVDPDAMRAHRVTIEQVYAAVRNANLDVGAQTIEINRVAYMIRGLGFIENLADVENSVVTVNDNVPIYVRNVATVSYGPAWRGGALDKGGSEAVGGVAVVRYGENPLAAIKSLKQAIVDLSPSLPEKVIVDWRQITPEQLRAVAAASGVQAYEGAVLNQPALLDWMRRTPPGERPAWATLSKVTIVPFYDRTGLIYETLGTLDSALTEEILVTLIVIVVMVMHLRSSVVIGLSLPLTVLLCFIAMKIFKVDANIVALSGIAIAIGTIVDMGIIVCENILRHLDEASPEEDRLAVVFRASSEVGSAVLTAVSTTIVGFLPVFAMIGAEGKLFRPLAFTKTFALFASLIVALTIVPALAHLLFTGKIRWVALRRTFYGVLVLAGITLWFVWPWWAGTLVVCVAAWQLVEQAIPERPRRRLIVVGNYAVALLVGLLLTAHWLPLGPQRSFLLNAVAVLGPIALLLAFFHLFAVLYAPILRWMLDHKALFLWLPGAIVVTGALIWLGVPWWTRWLPPGLRQNAVYSGLAHTFPGLNREFMPDLDEGSFLWMPTTMPHASIGEALDVLQKQDMAFNSIPEVESAVGKLGRAETPLDPAPTSMIETVINYRSEYLTDRGGRRLRFRFDPDLVDLVRDELGTPLPAPDGLPYQVRGAFPRDPEGRLIPDRQGRPFRLWRPALDPALNDDRPAWPGIRSPNDIWDAIVAAGELPGSTSAPKLQPIAARIVMLQSGMRAPMGIKVKGPDLESIEAFGLALEQQLKSGQIAGVNPAAVIADRIVGQPYLEIDLDREACARYGLTIDDVQMVIEVAIGGRFITSTVEGRERYPVRVRYQRELRDSIEELGRILVPGMDGQQIPLLHLAEIRYVRGPQMLKSEDTFLISYVLFDKLEGFAEVDVVEAAQRYLTAKEASGELLRPPGITYTFSGSYENQLRAVKTLSVVLPVALFIIFLILYFQFKAVPTTMLVFSTILVAWAGGFIMVWCYGQPWFLNWSPFGIDLRELFQVHPINLSVAVWVGFLALFGIAEDDGVVITTYLEQSFANRQPGTVAEIREAVVIGAQRRIRPCLMTSATTILALLPVLTSTGRGSDILVPMAIPSFGGMLIVLITEFVLPVLYSQLKEWQLAFRQWSGPASA